MSCLFKQQDVSIYYDHSYETIIYFFRNKSIKSQLRKKIIINELNMNSKLVSLRS